MRYYIIAGEASGDLHGSNLMRGLYAEDPQADIRFWGGGRMDEVFREHQQGTGLVKDYKDGAVMGFTQILLHARAFVRRFSDCTADIAAWNPDVVILIDYPGFNFRVAEYAHKAGFKVFYYIAPKVWASRESRVRKLKEYVDRLFIVFPFEIPYFTRKGVGFIYKGNPLIDAVDNSRAMTEDRAAFLSRTSQPDTPYIALLAGSRSGEISSMMPVFMEYADRMHSLPDYSSYRFIVAGAPSRTMGDYSGYVGDRDYVSVLFGETQSVMRFAEAAVVNSGTASLECALIGTPQVVAYRSSAVNYVIAKAIIKVRFISLGNLILDRFCFRELIQDYFTPENVLYEVRRLIEDTDYREEMERGYQEIREALGGKGASAAVAKSMIEELSKQ
ncbi:MAG: lipid-A-disaccharide synthase [Bacteroidales bacterium]|nr:lipid-A-disaccharide synthase [Bacteroidales bacterium]